MEYLEAVVSGCDAEDWIEVMAQAGWVLELSEGAGPNYPAGDVKVEFSRGRQDANKNPCDSRGMGRADRPAQHPF